MRKYDSSAFRLINDENIERFAQTKVSLNSQTECWEWNTATPYKHALFLLKDGSDYQEIGACVMAYLVNKRQRYIPHNFRVYHSCSNILCVNPAHLYLAETKKLIKWETLRDVQFEQNRLERTFKGY